MIIKLSSYLNKIEAKYIEARETWEKIQKKLHDEDERYNNIEWIKYSLEGKTAERNNHEETKSGIYKELEALREGFIKSAESIEAASDEIFDRKYQYKTGEIDLKGATLLQTGALKTDEIINIATDYLNSGNYTMYFMCADKLKQDKPLEQLSGAEERAESFYNTAQKMKEREDHALLEGFTDVCLKSLRNEDYLSDGIHKMHNEFYERYKNSAEEIEVKTESPWD